jgi:PKHD-type hydroxylase
MMLQIPEVLTKAQVAECRAIMDAASWVDGNMTSGFQAALAKNNQQLPQDSEAARVVGAIIVKALEAIRCSSRRPCPRRSCRRCSTAMAKAWASSDHVDNSVRRDPVTGQRLRTDLSATLFLAEPEDYDGGELVVDDLYGSHAVKLSAGDLILYPASSLHHVTQVTRGARTASFFWIQSLVRDDAKRALLLDMDVAIQRLSLRGRRGRSLGPGLTGTYHNLLRQWAEV